VPILLYNRFQMGPLTVCSTLSSTGRASHIGHAPELAAPKGFCMA